MTKLQRFGRDRLSAVLVLEEWNNEGAHYSVGILGVTAATTTNRLPVIRLSGVHVFGHCGFIISPSRCVRPAFSIPVFS